MASTSRDELARELDESPYAASKEKFLDKFIYGYQNITHWDLDLTESKN